MTIQELADAAGVTTRTIRYYVEEGVLPPPERGRPAEYTGEHVRLLDVVRRLKEQYLPLEEIRDILSRLSPQEVEQFLAQTESRTPPATELSTATDYISKVIQRGALRSQLKEQAAPSQHSQPSRPPQRAPERMPPRATALPAPIVSAPGAAPGAGRRAEKAAASSATAEDEDAYISAGRTWQRVTLAPGVELHYIVPLGAGMRASISRLITAAKNILVNTPGNNVEEQNETNSEPG